MGQLKANRADEAVKELKDFGFKAEEIKGLNQTIKKTDKKHVHVIIVKKQNNPLKEEYDRSFYVQIYNKRGFANLKNHVKSMPISKLVVLHDPSLEKDDEKVETLTAFQEQQVNARVDAHLKQKESEDRKDLKAQLRQEILDEMNVEGAGSGNSLGDFDAAAATLPQLQKFAKDNNVDLGDSKELEAVRAAVIKWSKK